MILGCKNRLSNKSNGLVEIVLSNIIKLNLEQESANFFFSPGILIIGEAMRCSCFPQR